MDTYEMRKQKLPWDILVLKEVAKRILSSRQYSWFIKHKIMLSKKKGNGRGYYNTYSHNIVIGIGREKYDEEKHTWSRFYANGTNKDVLRVFVHELAHMVQFHDKRIDNSKNYHNKTFKKLLVRLEKNFKTKVEPMLYEIICKCKERAM